jgi:3-oxoacyl-[acyl-carrier protein] reductase
MIAKYFNLTPPKAAICPHNQMLASSLQPQGVCKSEHELRRKYGDKMIDTGLKNKVAMITGVNNPYGIGATTAKAFAAEGAAVFVTYLRLPAEESTTNVPGESFFRAQNAKTADEVVTAIRERGGKVEAWEADLTNPSVIPQLFDRAEKAFGPVDILVNNAAYFEPDTFIPQSQLGSDSRAVDEFPMSTITADKHDRHFAVNSRAVALMMAEYARRLIKRSTRWGRIINVSTDGASGFSSEVSYGASKHALESYNRAAAGELGKYGITVNIVSLGPVQTGWISPEMEKEETNHIPLGRVGKPEDVANVIVFFASEQASWITGQLLYVGGGHVMPL